MPRLEVVIPADLLLEAAEMPDGISLLAKVVFEAKRFTDNANTLCEYFEDLAKKNNG